MANSNSHTSHRIPPYRRPLVVISFLAILTVVILVTILLFKNFDKPDDSSVSNPKPSSPGTVQTPNSNDNTTTTPSTDPEEPDSKVTQYEGEDPNELNSLTGSIAFKNVDHQTNVLRLAASISQYLHDDGVCTVSLKRDNITVRTMTLPATPDVTTSVCGPFELSIADLPSGSYEIEIQITGDGKSGHINEGVWL